MSREAWLLVGAVGVIVAVAALVGAVVLAVKVVRTRRMLTELGAGGKVAFYGALIYAIFPVDVLPDPIFLDDLGVLAGALVVLTRLAQRQRAARSLPGPPAWPTPRPLPPPFQSRPLPPPPGRRLP